MSEETVVTEQAPDVEQIVKEEVAPAKPANEINYHELINADGTFKDEFYTNLPDDLGSHSSLKQIKNATDLAKSFVSTKSMMGKKAEEFLTSDDPAVIAKRNEILGVPESKDGYTIEIPELPEGTVYNEQRADAFKDIASQAGLTNEQVQKLVEWDIESSSQVQTGMAEMLEQQRQEAEAALKKDWGTQYEYNNDKVKSATDYLGITEDMKAIGLDDSPEFKKMVLDKLVPAISNDKLVEAQADTVSSSLDSLNDLDDKMDSWTGSTQDPVYQKMVAQRAQLLARVSVNS